MWTNGAFYDFTNHGLMAQTLDYSRVNLFRSLRMSLLPVCNSGKVYFPICKEMTNRERKRRLPGLQKLCRESWRKSSKAKVVLPPQSRDVVFSPVPVLDCRNFQQDNLGARGIGQVYHSTGLGPL